MRFDTPYNVTEWEWFQLKLKLYSLEYRGLAWVTRFSYPEPGKVRCAIWCNTVQDLIDKKADRKKQLKFYENWVLSERYQITRLLEDIPVLKSEMDIDRDIEFEILYDYGMGSETVCSFDSAGIHWRMDEPEKSMKKRRKSPKRG